MVIKSLIQLGALVREAAFLAVAEPLSPGRAASPALRLSRQQDNWLRSYSVGAAATALLVATACALAHPSAGEAAQTNLTLVCPSDGRGAPQLGDRSTGKTLPITDPQLAAVAAESCNAGAGQYTVVHIVNRRAAPIFVNFSTRIAPKVHVPGPIAWGAGCQASTSGGGVKIAVGATCVANLPSTGDESRFCAVLSPPAPADCFDAQINHQTMIETNFEPASNPGCFNQGNCVWYDVSVIPSFCTDTLWTQNKCASAGGASYNLPVELSCNGSPIYTCQGPQNNAYGSANYPSSCGNPNATCNGAPNSGPVSKQCKNAYFYPDPPKQPNTGCFGGKNVIFTITFLPGS